MQIQNKIKSLSIFLFIIAASFAFAAFPAYAGTLFIDPASPFVQAGGEITLTVTNASGEVTWSAFEGDIEKTGYSVVYKAPDRVTTDAVTAMDKAGNIGFVNVVVEDKNKVDERFLRENANWEIFTSRKLVMALLLSDDGSILWVGTTGGLEKRDAVTGELIQVLNNKDGLPSNWIFTLLSDGKGGIWVGTGDGLVNLKSDGKLEILKTNNSKLPDNSIYALLSDGSGGLWIGTTFGGLAHFQSNRTWEIFNKDNSKLQDNMIQFLLSDKEGGLWIGTEKVGLAHLKANKTWDVFNKDNSKLPDNFIQSLLSDGEGGLWIGTENSGLAHLKSDGKLEVLTTDNSGLSNNRIKSILSDGSGGFWIGTYGGIAHFKSDKTWEVFKTDNSGLPNNAIEYMLSDGNSGLWIGTNDKGLVRFKSDGTWNTFQADNSGLSNNLITSLLSDGSGGIWIGTKERGISHLKSDGQWEIFTPANSQLPAWKVNTMVSDDNGGLWIVTDGGGFAHLRADRTWYTTSWIIRSSGEVTNITSLLSDGNGGAWLGLDCGEIHYYNADETSKFFVSTSRLPDSHILSMLSDGNSGFWLGTKGGLVHYKPYQKSRIGCNEISCDTDTWEVFNNENSKLPDNNVYSLLSDGDGGLWIGTGGGLASFKSDGTWEVFTTDNSGLPRDKVNALLLDNTLLSDVSKGLWIGTEWGGLARLKSDKTWDVFNKDNSRLPHNWITSLLSDEKGGLWIGTIDSGLAHLKFQSLQALEEQYRNGKRASIIIASGGNSDDNSLWKSTEKISNYIYNMLNTRGFLNTDIHYISPQPFADFNGDGFDDSVVDAPVPSRQIQLSDIQEAFDWAKTKGELNQPLYIFFTDHGGTNQLQLAKGVYIEASELKTMVDDYQSATNNKVVFVIDACHSGTMVKSLAGKNRAVISSTDDGVAYFDRLNGQSFIWYVAKALNNGMSFAEAFYDASSEYKKALGKISQYESISAGIGTISLTQEPQFDDTGDGIYNISDEGNWLKHVYINGSFTVADITLNVKELTQSGIIPASTGSTLNDQTLLKAKVTTGSGTIKRVWAVIRPPKMDILVDNTGIPLLFFPSSDLSLSKTEKDVYEGGWRGFVYNGEYEITFYAEDNQGNIESSESIKLTVGDGMVCPEKGSLKVNISKEPDSTGKIVYKSGDNLKISVTENLAYGYDLYAALLMPDGNFTALKSPLKDLNYLQAENFNHLYQTDKWNTQRDMGRPLTVVDMVLAQDTLSQAKLPSGQYCLYAALIPEGEDLMVSAEKGLIVLDGVCFEVSVDN